MSKKSSVRLLFWMFILFLSSAIISLAIPRISARNAYAWGEEISTVEPDSKWLTKEYRDVYQLMPNQNFTYKFAYNAYSGYPLSNAFDGNFNSVFISQRAISSNTDVYIDIDFNRNATIDRIVYKSMSYNGVASGFPTNLKVWYGVGSYTSNSVTFETYSPTSDIVVFKFSQPITANKLRFQFVDITVVNNSLSGTLAVPSAAEIMFFQPEHSSVDIVSDLFTDYRWTELNPKYANMETMALLRKELSGHANYQSAYLPRIERAEALLNGTAGYVEGREFATDDTNLRK
ncbi:MAG: discoidin domain-containing protein, partial [Muribaculaceae bacterium]|nr:discoidin domain-containing protein [Muribaculaceae bacterium]